MMAIHPEAQARAGIDALLLREDDLPIVEGCGSVGQIGRVALWDGSIAGCVPRNHLIKVRCSPVVPSWFVPVWCLSPYGRPSIERVASSSAGLHTLSISEFQSLPIPAPPDGVLGYIRDAFDRMEAMTGVLVLSVEDEARRSNALRQAILKAALSGRWVPHDPTDEPASALLARPTDQANSAPTAPRRRDRSHAA